MKSNEELIQAVKQEMPEHDQKVLEGVTSGVAFLQVAEQYKPIMNSFIETLTNKIAKSLIFSKIYENPLKQLKKGKLEYGETIEELFVQMAVAKNFGEHWGDGSNTPEADLIRKITPKVTAMYTRTNFDKKYKTTVMDKQLRKAFTTEHGLAKLVLQIIGSLTSQAEKQEFIYTKKIMNSLVENCQSWGLDADHGVETNVDLKGTVVKQTPYIVNCGNDPKKLIKEIKTVVGDMTFPSTKYNLAKEENWCNPENLVLITTSDVSADIDVNVLASAFNVSMTDIKTKTILVDKMPEGIFKNQTALTDKKPHDILSSESISTDKTKTPKAILCDEDLFQIWDEYQGTETFRNGDGRYTNYFANREGTFAVCTFANMAIFY